MCLALVNPHMLSELREQELEALWIGPADVGTVVWTLADYFRNQICTLPSEKSAQSWDWIFRLRFILFYPTKWRMLIWHRSRAAVLCVAHTAASG